MGCLKSCVDYLGLDISDGWLYGGTGQAFILNLSPDLCPSGPTAWKTETLFKLGRNLGYTFEGIFGHKSMPDFKEKQRKAYELVIKSIDAGFPCYGWELAVAEFYLINGYDDTGYIYKELMGPLNNSKKWDTHGETGIGIIEIYSVRPGETAKVSKIVKDSLMFTLEHDETRKYLLPNYESGIQGYETWIKGLKEKTATTGGLSYNSAVWSECRKYAVDFLVEAAEKLENRSLFEKAIEYYGVVSENLNKLVELYPFNVPPDYETQISDEEKAETAIMYVEKAMNAEKRGLIELGKICKAL